MPPQSPVPTTPLQQIVLSKKDLEDESLTLLNNQLTNYTQMINYLLGHLGEVRINSHINMGGNKVRNIGAASDPSDAVSQLVGDGLYGPPVIKKHIEALGNHVLQTFRQLSNSKQREKYSSFLNDVLNTAPTSNTSIVGGAPPSGGTQLVTVTAGLHVRVDGSAVAYPQRSDLLTLPGPGTQSVYYYTLSAGQGTLGLVFNSGTPDSWLNRVSASKDGTTIIAVLAMTPGGADPVNSGAGATDPQAGAKIPVVRRL